MFAVPPPQAAEHANARPERSGLLPSLAGLTTFALTVLLLMLGPVSGTSALGSGSVLAIATAGAATIAICLSGGPRRREWPLAVAVGAVVAFPALRGMLGAEHVDWAPLAVGLAVAGIILAVPRGRPDLWRLIILLTATAVVWINLGFGVAELSDADLGAFYSRNDRNLLGLPQLRGVAGHPNTLAAIVSLALILQVQSARAGTWRAEPAIPGRPAAFRRAVVWAGIVPSILVLGWAQSRTGLAMALVGLLVVLLPLPRRRAALASWGVMSAVAIGSLLVPWVSDRFGWAVHGRYVAWEHGWRAFTEHPVMGFGSDLYSPDHYWPTHPGELWEPQHAHSLSVQMLGVGGGLGLLLLLAFVLVTVGVAVRSRGRDQLWGMGSLAVLFCYGSVEVPVGVGTVSATYLPILLTATVLASSLAAATRVSPLRRDAPPRRRNPDRSDDPGIAVE